MARARLFAFTLIAVLALVPLAGGGRSVAQPQQPQQPQRPQTPIPAVSPSPESATPTPAAQTVPTLPPPVPVPSSS